MITLNRYSMSVKELCARLSVLLVVMLACVPSFAQDEQEVTYPVITGLGNGKFIITVNAGHQIGGPGNSGIDLTDEKYSALATATEIRVVTENCQLKPADMERLCSNDFQMSTLDLSGAQIEGITGLGANNEGKNALNKLGNSATITTVVFPIQNGMIIPTHCFGEDGNRTIQNIIIPDYPDGSSYKIWTNAFEKCHALRTASIGKGTLSLGGDPYDLPTLADPDNPTMAEVSNLNFWYTDQTGGSIFSDCENLYSVVLDKNITCIKYNTFKGCVKLDYIVLPEALKALGPGAFEDCEKLATITIPAGFRFWGGQVFSKCNSLTDVYLLGENIPLPVAGDQGGPINIQQTTNFYYTAGDDPTYSQKDYTPTNPGDPYTIAILHYPGTDRGKKHYRWEGATDYSNVDENGTSWPNAQDINKFNIAKEGFDRNNDVYNGWKFFLQGEQTNKTNDIIDITRFKESRWYSICFPFDVTIAQFQSAFGARAALSEFNGITDDENGLTIKFTQAAVDRSTNGIMLKKNHSYMIHPEKLATDQSPLTVYNIVNFLEQERDPSVWAKRNALQTRLNRVQNNSWDDYKAAYPDDTPEIVDGQPNTQERETARIQTLLDNENYRLRNVWTDEQVHTYNKNYNKEVWQTNIEDEDNSGGKRIRRYENPRNNITFYFKGNYMGTETHTDPVALPAGCYYLGGGAGTGWAFGIYYRLQAGSTWTPYTSILEAEENAVDNGAKSFGNLYFEDLLIENAFGEQATGIDKELFIRIPANNGRVFNMQGQQVSNNGINGLPKGLYIMNGKKYIVK